MPYICSKKKKAANYFYRSKRVLVTRLMVQIRSPKMGFTELVITPRISLKVNELPTLFRIGSVVRLWLIVQGWDNEEGHRLHGQKEARLGELK